MVFGGYELDPRSRWEDGVPVGARGAVAAARLGAVRAADGRRDPALPVPRRRRGDPAGLPPGRDDARREPAARAAARGSRVLGRGRAVAQRVRGRWRDRPGDGRLDHGRRPGRRHRAVPGVAVRRHVPRSGVRGRARPRDVLRLLPPALPVRRGRGRAAAAAVRAPRPAPGGRRGLRHEGRLGAGRLPRAGPAVAACRARPGRRTAGRGRPGSSGCARRRGPSASGPGSSTSASFGKIAVEGPGALGAAPARQRERYRPAGRERRLHPVVRRARRDGRRRDRHAPRRRPVPGRDGRRLRRVRAGLAARPTSRDDEAVSIRDVSGDLATIGLWGPQGAGRPGRRGRRGRRGRQRGDPDAPGALDPGRARAGRRGPDQLRRRARLGADDARRVGGRRSGIGSRAAGAESASSRSATARSTPSGWRRAIATSAPT